MKIIFVGGGTGGHFYPLISVAEEISVLAQTKRLVQPKMYYVADKIYDDKILYETGVKYIHCPSGKLRRTGGLDIIKNFFSFFIILFGIFKALFIVYRIFPDVVFSKGGYASFPVLVAARFWKIPVVIHDSDAKLGRVSKYSAKFAQYIGISFVEAEKDIPKNKIDNTIIVGVPIRKDLIHNPISNGRDLFKIAKTDKKVILVLGGSQGSTFINENLLDILGDLIKDYYVIHQTGKNNINEVYDIVKSFYGLSENIERYKPTAFLTTYYMRAAYSVADLVITRAGSNSLAEIAEWGIPSIVIPIPEEVSHDQTTNAYAYSRLTGATVIEQQNLKKNIFLQEIKNIFKEENYKKLKENTKGFRYRDSSKKIAQQLIHILKEHEK